MREMFAPLHDGCGAQFKNRALQFTKLEPPNVQASGASPHAQKPGDHENMDAGSSPASACWASEGHPLLPIDSYWCDRNLGEYDRLGHPLNLPESGEHAMERHV